MDKSGNAVVSEQIILDHRLPDLVGVNFMSQRRLKTRKHSPQSQSLLPSSQIIKRIKEKESSHCEPHFSFFLSLHVRTS
jgi:hypothetical protein